MILQILFLSACIITWGDTLSNFHARIINGKEVNIEEFPFQASVRYNGVHHCGGSILNSNTILTAAHCVYEYEPTTLSVAVGVTAHNDGPAVLVFGVIIHNLYNNKLFHYDIAILKLESRLSFNSRVQPIALQEAGVAVPPGSDAWVSGWGCTEQNANELSNKLRAVQINVISNDECDFKYGGGVIFAHMLCAQTPDKDACQGDSGGPLIANGKLIGVVSKGCETTKYPGIYTNVSNMHNWIVSHQAEIPHDEL